LNAHCAPWYSGGHACSSVITPIKHRLVLGPRPRLAGACLKHLGGATPALGVVEFFERPWDGGGLAAQANNFLKVDLGSGRDTR
jgi:hypothetical protein